MQVEEFVSTVEDLDKKQAEYLKKQPDLFTQPPKEKYKSLKDLYLEFIVPSVESIKSTLISCFGEERFELTTTKQPNFLTWLESNDKGSEKENSTFLERCIKGVESSCRDWRKVKAYDIIIHFPELFIKNICMVNHRITDMYIKLELSLFLSDIHHRYGFVGMRTSYTFAEYSSGYNFSHLSGPPDTFRWSSFCLGETHFSTLCMSIATEFDKNFFGLFCYQLEQYLSWESLEGGPYKRIGDISERGSSLRTVIISSTDKITYYKLYLQSGHTPNIEIKSNQWMFSASVIIDDHLREGITKIVTNNNHLQHWDSSTKIARSIGVNNREEEQRQLLAAKPNTIFTFKGKDIKFELTDMVKKKEEKDNSNKVAHTDIITYIVGKLNCAIDKNIQDEFIKKRRVYTAR